MTNTPQLVCIVDDDASLRRALGRLVRSFGFEVELFASGQECLDDSAIERSACLILDVSMPGMDGFEVLALLQASGRSVPTVLISAYDDENYRDKARSAGVVALLRKPCDEKLLLGAIDQSLAS